MSGGGSAGLRMSHHYADPPAFETTRKLSTARSYNDKARDALPGLGGGALDTTYRNGKFMYERDKSNVLWICLK
jgi:hypothetical protein